MKRGYLNDNFRLFHLNDSHAEPFEYHYHDFQKIIIFISGNVTYMVEGKIYNLMPYDILFVNHHDIHKPIIQPGVPYERVILWINRNFLEQDALKAYHLNECFQTLQEKKSNLLRAKSKNRLSFFSLLNELEASLRSTEFAHELYSSTLFIQLMITINRLLASNSKVDTTSSIQSNKHVDKLISYINENLAGDLSINKLSQELYLSPSYMMHQFKEVTGSSLHSYITRKRLSYAIELMRTGTHITLASEQSGYNDYSTFLRTFRKLYHCTPTEYLIGKANTSPFSEQQNME